MKRLNKKLLTFALAGACAASLCAATINVVSSAEESEGVAVSSVFALSKKDEGTIDVETATGAETGTVRFTLSNGQSAYMQRDLALKWHESNEGASYMQMKFAFKSFDFESVTFKVESASSVVTEEEKAVNEVTFFVEGTQLKVSVNDGTKVELGETATLAGTDITLALTAAVGNEFGSFGVKVNNLAVGTFTNVGANYADYALGKTLPLSIIAKAAADKQAVILFKELNGQKFDNVKEDKIEDTAAPILVVNEEISSFQYGTAFALNYEKIDVLQDSSLTENKLYYQYNPTDTEAIYDKTLSGSTYFMDTVYYTDGTNVYKEQNEQETLRATSVRAEEGREYVSVKITLGDKATNTKDYFLAWYATGTVEKELTKDTVTKKTDYIVIDENTDGATYSYLVAKEGENKYAINGDVSDQAAAKADVEKKIKDYEKLLADAAKDVKASGSSSISLPSLDWLIKDNGGYRGLRFTISYKTPSSSSTKTASNLLYNGLKFSTSEEGEYEFKVFANDAAGNTMKYYLDDELVSVNSTNVWDIEEIYSFTFVIQESEISVKEPTKDTDKRAEKIVDTTYTLSGITVEGATNEQESYALYVFDDSNYSQIIKDETLLLIRYESIIDQAKPLFSEVGQGKKFADYTDAYVYAYASLIAKEIKGGTAPTDEEIEAVKACFRKINEYNSEITEENDAENWKNHNRYRWDATGKSFNTVEEGRYFIFADFHEDYLPAQRAAAYKLIVVESKADVIKGESQFSAWVKNNVVSVVLFGIAGLMLIAVIVLLFVHPSDETLEDVDAKAEEKKTKKK